MKMTKEIGTMDVRWIEYMQKHGLLFLRYALGIVFLWFGALKVFDLSPVADLVSATLFWFPPDFIVPALGILEVLIGIGLLLNAYMRVTLTLFWLQMAGTFLVLIIRPDLAFQSSNPLLLTTIGEFVVKNFVLITAGIAIGGSLKEQKKLKK